MASFTSNVARALESRLEAWRGVRASFNTYRDDHDRLILGLERPGDPADKIGLCLFYCTRVSGPTRWESARLVCRSVMMEDGVLGFEIEDVAAGFLARGHGPVSLGDHWKDVFPRS